MSVKNTYPLEEISVDEIEHNLPFFLQRVEAGVSFVIIKAGKPLAEIKPLEPVAKSLRPFGLGKGEFVTPDDFDAPLPENILKEFEGR